MGIKASLSKPFAKYVVKKNLKWVNNPLEAQENTLKNLVDQAKNTVFGKEWNLKTVETFLVVDVLKVENN